MKKAIHLLSLLLLTSVTLIITSCGDDDNGNVTPTNPCDQGTLTMQLNGVQWSATSFNNTLIYANDPSTGYDTRRCDIRAIDADGNQLILTFNNVDVPDDNCMDTGDYKSISNVTSSTDNAILYTYISNSDTTYSATEGTFNISSCDANNNRQMEGTFTFETLFPATLNATNGQFSICVQ